MKSNPTLLKSIDLEEIVTIAKRAGDAIMEIYARDISVKYKEDNSPLTEADLKSHEIIVKGLTSIGAINATDDTQPLSLPILSEEGKSIPYEERKNWEYYWCIDPIDGTKEFIKKNGEFTVNIALIHNDVPVLGVVYAPALGDMYKAKKGIGAFKNGQHLPLETNSTPEKSLKVVASKSHLSEETQEFIDALETESVEQVSKGSSLKLCMVAEGTADLYPRLAPTMEWDTAAADAIVRASGKMTYQYHPDSKTPTPEPLVYNKADLLNPWFVVKSVE